MGRPSKLTDAQWTDIERRLLEGESRRSLANEFGISEGAIRQRLSTQVEEIKELAKTIVTVEERVKALPIGSQITTHSLAAKLRAISTSLASAAELGAATAHRLSALANSEVCKVDDANPLGSVESLKGVSALTRLANDSANIALNLLSANKEAVKRIGEPDPEDGPPSGVLVVPGVIKDSNAWTALVNPQKVA